MTSARIAPIAPAIGPVIRDRIRDLRERAGLDREELAERACGFGAGEKFTANVVGFLERGRRGLTVEELLAIAQALEVSPLELLGDQAAVFVGDAGAVEAIECPKCSGDAGQMETAVRADMAKLGDLGPLEDTLVQTAIRLAGAIDAARGEAAKELPRLTRELRGVTEQLLSGRRKAPDPDDENDLDDLDAPD